MQTRHLHEIDALRGLAACGVAFFSHFNILSGVKGGPLQGVPGFDWLYAYGTTLVDLFFVLSGFVMCYVYADRQTMQLKNSVTWRGFIVARLARLYPLHVATLILVALLMQHPAVRSVEQHLPYDAYHFLLNLLFLQRSGLETYHSFNISAWSLTAEMAAYVAFFVVAHRARSLSLSSVLLITLAVGLSATGALNGYVSRGLVGFFVGVLFWLSWPSIERVPAWALAAVLAVGFWLTFYARPAGTAPYYLASVLVWPALVALAFRKPFSQALGTRPLRWLGDVSFSVYLLHFPIYLLRPVFLGTNPVAAQYWLLLNVGSAALVLLLAHLSFRCFETPMREAMKAGVWRPSIAGVS